MDRDRRRACTRLLKCRVTLQWATLTLKPFDIEIARDVSSACLVSCNRFHDFQVNPCESTKCRQIIARFTLCTTHILASIVAILHYVNDDDDANADDTDRKHYPKRPYEE